MNADQRADYERQLERTRQLAQMSDEVLIATAPGPADMRSPMEMDRRLKVAIMDLTTETIAARRSSDRAARRLVWLNFAVAVLTAALVALTVVLAVKG